MSFTWFAVSISSNRAFSMSVNPADFSKSYIFLPWGLGCLDIYLLTGWYPVVIRIGINGYLFKISSEDKKLDGKR